MACKRQTLTLAVQQTHASTTKPTRASKLSIPPPAPLPRSPPPPLRHFPPLHPVARRPCAASLPASRRAAACQADPLHVQHQRARLVGFLQLLQRDGRLPVEALERRRRGAAARGEEGAVEAVAQGGARGGLVGWMGRGVLLGGV
jgi:hypothetical protein